MKRVHIFSLHERPQAVMVRELLETEGIACLVRNEQLFAAMGEIPLTECFPELWVLDDEVYPRARLLVERWLRPEPGGGPWNCPGCGEALEGQFGACWKCGQLRE